jgi:hypothetical protein
MIMLCSGWAKLCWATGRTVDLVHFDMYIRIQVMRARRQAATQLRQ